MSRGAGEAKRISIFNHKGGVGKTTLTVNIAAALAEQGRRVLLIDSDPQCNLTSYLIEEDVLDDLLDTSDGPDGRTIWSAVRPVSQAMGSVAIVQPFETSIENVYLLPGDIQLAEFENDLNDFWNEGLQRKLRGFRGTTALSELTTELCAQHGFDYVFFDSGPNIGPLNRVILLDCDGFIVPVACDLFSLRALKTLGRAMVGWLRDWRTVADLAPEGFPLLHGSPAFLGYVPGQFRVYAQRVVRKQASFLTKIDVEMQSQVANVLRAVQPGLAPSRRTSLRIGEVKDLGALVSTAQSEGRPLWLASGGNQEQRQATQDAFHAIANALRKRTEG